MQSERQIANFTRYLKLLHRLSVTTHDALCDLFDDYLRTGCEIFGVPYGALTSAGQDRPVVCVKGLNAGEEPDARIHHVLRTGETQIYTGAAETFFIGAPVVLGTDAYGVLSFWSDEFYPVQEAHHQAKEVIELLARSVGVAIHHRRLTDQLAHQAMHDALTGLPNRLLMKERLDSALDAARRGGTNTAVVFIDLDRFKEINDTLGHAIGDDVLRQVAGRLQGCLGPEDTLARMGGDEFTAILNGFQNRDEAVVRVRNLLRAVRIPCRFEQHELFVTASIGVSFYPDDGENASTLLRNADTAMYTAKGRGKNEAYCFDAEMTGSSRERLDLETQMRGALERGEFELRFQPQVDLDGNLAGVEALIGWEHPALGCVTPARFIPIAEETGMIVEIGSWVLRRACERMAAWLLEGVSSITMAVNVSALQFAQPDFVTVVEEMLAQTGLPPGVLELEVTESLIMRDVQQSATVMSKLRRSGVKIAIDDFGTGYSSLSYLRTLPADTLKIDRSFLSDIEKGDAAALVETIVTLGHALGLTVTAEGVETEEQLQVLRKAGCDRVQGHLIGVAITEQELGPLLANATQPLFSIPQ